MPLKFMYLVSNPISAHIADESGVDYLFYDLETLGKEERQKGIDSVKSHNTFENIPIIRSSVSHGNFLVRINHPNENTQQEVERCVEGGADVIMLPYFKSANEVLNFVHFVGKRAKTCLLFETMESVDHIDEILSIPGIDMIHIGINDLHLEMKLSFMFKTYSIGIIDYICKKAKQHNTPCGIGGLSHLGDGIVPANDVLLELTRLHANTVILSRNFYHIDEESDQNQQIVEFSKNLQEVRELENHFSSMPAKSIAEENERILMEMDVNAIKERNQ